MNPLVQVSSSPGSAAAPPQPSALEQYHVALVAGSSLAQLRRWDEACAAAGVPFFGAMSRGTVAFLFADLLEHSYTTEASRVCCVPVSCCPAAPNSGFAGYVAALYRVGLRAIWASSVAGLGLTGECMLRRCARAPA